MDLQELSAIWKSADQPIENHMKVNRMLLKEASIRKVKTHLGEFKWSSIIEIVCNALFLMFLTGFIADHLLQLAFSVPALILMALSICSLVFNIYKLTLFYRIDAKASVLQTQKNIERLKYYDLAEKNMLYIIIPVFSVTFLIVMAKALLDFSLYALGNWLLHYTIGSFVVGLIVVFLLKRYPAKLVAVTTRCSTDCSVPAEKVSR